MQTLITLPYAPDALAPAVSEQTVSFHHGKHLATYVNNLNKAIGGTPMEGMSLEDLIVKSAAEGLTPMFNNAGQTLNHNMYFLQFSSIPKTAPEGALKDAIDVYKLTCAPKTVTAADGSLTVAVGQADTVSLSRLSAVGDGYEELDHYIDLAVECFYDRAAGTLTVDTSWWYDPSDWVDRYDTWSYLIRTVSGDKETYRYFRVRFTR